MKKIAFLLFLGVLCTIVANGCKPESGGGGGGGTETSTNAPAAPGGTNK